MTPRARIFVAAGLLLILLPEFPTQVLRSADRGETRVVFLSNRDCSTEPGRGFDVFLLDLKNMKTENLTRGLPGLAIRSNSLPKLDTKKNSAIFISYDGRSLVALNIATRTVTKIVNVTYEATSYAVSPDGDALLYVERVDSTLQLLEVDVAGGTPRNLTSNPHNNFEASYSPAGKKIAYVCDADGSNSITVMNRNGKDQKILTNLFGDDRYPHWSPDCKKIIFSSSRSGSTDAEYHLYAIDASGRNLKLFYQSKAFNAFPVYSPDDKYVAFVTNARGGMHKDIMIKELASGLIRTVTHEMNDANDTFSIGDGGRIIVFENSGPLDSEIWMYDVQSKKMKNLSNHQDRDSSPAMDEHSQGSR